MGRDFLKLSDLGADGLVEVLDTADRFKQTRGSVGAWAPLTGKSAALVFEKASTRTRMSLEIAVAELGGHPAVLEPSGSHLSRGEPIEDTARVLSRMAHVITFRTYSEERLVAMANHSDAPVLNALTDRGHPMQLLADLQTVRAVRGRLDGLRYVWIGDGNNMANSWIEAAGLLKLELALAIPEGFDPDAGELELARRRGGNVTVLRDPAEAVENADVISTDVFASMGQEGQAAKRLKAFRGFRVDRSMVSKAHDEVVVLHCLPAHRGEEIEAEVLEGPRSFVWAQAEARLHTAKAVLAWSLEAHG